MRDLNTTIMETIIGLLFILLPVILKLVGKRLEQSGQPEKAKKLQDLLDTVYDGKAETEELETEDEPDDDLEVEYIKRHAKEGNLKTFHQVDKNT